MVIMVTMIMVDISTADVDTFDGEYGLKCNADGDNGSNDDGAF